MSDNHTTTKLEALANKKWTATLVVLSSYTVVASGLLLWFEGLPTFVRIPIALPLLLFSPGYAVVTALIPTTRTAPREVGLRNVSRDTPLRRGLSMAERITLAVVASIALVPVIALTVNAIVGIELRWVFAGISALTVVSSCVGIGRSSAKRPAEGGNVTDKLKSHVPTDSITLASIAVAALLLGSSAAISLSPNETGGDRTEFYLVNESENGTDIASGYPQSFELGEEKAYHLRVKHHENSPQQYTVAVLLRNRGSSGQKGASSLPTELDRFSMTVKSGETATKTYYASPTTTGENLTLQFLLYRKNAPPKPRAATAHRALDVSVNVTQNAGGDNDR